MLPSHFNKNYNTCTHTTYRFNKDELFKRFSAKKSLRLTPPPPSPKSCGSHPSRPLGDTSRYKVLNMVRCLLKTD